MFVRVGKIFATENVFFIEDVYVEKVFIIDFADEGGVADLCVDEGIIILKNVFGVPNVCTVDVICGCVVVIIPCISTSPLNSKLVK